MPKYQPRYRRRSLDEIRLEREVRERPPEPEAPKPEVKCSSCRRPAQAPPKPEPKRTVVSVPPRHAPAPTPPAGNWAARQHAGVDLPKVELKPRLFGGYNYERYGEELKQQTAVITQATGLERARTGHEEAVQARELAAHRRALIPAKVHGEKLDIATAIVHKEGNLALQRQDVEGEIRKNGLLNKQDELTIEVGIAELEQQLAQAKAALEDTAHASELSALQRKKKQAECQREIAELNAAIAQCEALERQAQADAAEATTVEQRAKRRNESGINEHLADQLAATEEHNEIEEHATEIIEGLQESGRTDTDDRIDDVEQAKTLAHREADRARAQAGILTRGGKRR